MWKLINRKHNTTPQGRVEAIDKVTGKGRYTADHPVDQVCHAFYVTSTIPAGRIKLINVQEARQINGVIDILTHTNKPDVSGLRTQEQIEQSRIGLPFLHTDRIYFKGQPIALVIAETLEDAIYAASMVKVTYNKDPFFIDFALERSKLTTANTGKERGSLEQWQQAPYIVNQEYTIKSEAHHPMETHATLALWPASDKIKVFDKSQGVNAFQSAISRVFDVPAENIEVHSEFVGGGFGSALRVWTNTFAAIMASKHVGRPVKLALSRQQMTALTGYRPESWQSVKMGMDANGKILGLHHKAMHNTSQFEQFSEGITRISRLIYQIDNLKTETQTVPLHLSTPTWMRGPGDCTGDFAIESAIDELCYQIGKDPVEVHLLNISDEKDPESGKPWSTNFLKECVTIGAEKIGWSSRPTQPGMLTEGDWQIGYGMAVGLWTAGRQKSSARMVLQSDGTLLVQTAMTDIGTGTGTAMVNMAHQFTGMPKTSIKISLGNSSLPSAPMQGGSTGLSSLSGSVEAAGTQLKEQIIKESTVINSSYKDVVTSEVVFSEKGFYLEGRDLTFVSYEEFFKQVGGTEIAVEATSGPGEERQKYAFCSSAAHFCIVKVHKWTGKVKVDRMVCVVDGGTIVNDKAAANQISGGATGGIGMALMEERTIDFKQGSLVADDLAGYHFAVNADVPIIEVSFINKPDVNINPSGAKGLGEVGIIGCAAAIANAIYNASGKRLRHLPMTPDKVLQAKSDLPK